MEQPRFKDLDRDSFFGDFLYLQIVPRDHFLVRLNQIIDWDDLGSLFLPAYQGLGQVGNIPYHPVVLFKMLLLAYLYKLSERQIEEFVNYCLPAKEFVGLAVNVAAPDHSTLSVFKTHLLEFGLWDQFAGLSDAVLQQAQSAGIQFGKIQLIDSVHTVADVDNDADRRRQDQASLRDPQAQLVNKGKHSVKQPDGTVKIVERQYLGYKSHVSLNAETGLITSLVVTPGNAADNLQFPKLLAHDESLNVAAEIYSGDKAYDDTDLHFRLWEQGKHSALRLKRTRTGKKDGNKQVWLDLEQTPEYAAGLKERYKIERKFGEAKRWHGFGRCRYLGLPRYGIQAFLMVLALNLKRIVQLLTGVLFRPPSRKRVGLLHDPVALARLVKVLRQPNRTKHFEKRTRFS
jgi:IS5 family transposase